MTLSDTLNLLEYRILFASLFLKHFLFLASIVMYYFVQTFATRSYTTIRRVELLLCVTAPLMTYVMVVASMPEMILRAHCAMHILAVKECICNNRASIMVLALSIITKLYLFKLPYLLCIYKYASSVSVCLSYLLHLHIYTWGMSKCGLRSLIV